MELGKSSKSSILAVPYPDHHDDDDDLIFLNTFVQSKSNQIKSHKCKTVSNPL